MDTSEFLTLQSMTNNRCNMSDYEHQCLAGKSAKQGLNTAIVGIVGAGLAIAGVVGAWVYSGSRANGNKELIDANAAHSREMSNLLATTMASERSERVANQTEVNRTVVDIYNNANAAANSSSNAYAQAEAQIVSDRLTGRSQMCPTPVSLYSAPSPCGCPNTCGCNN